TQHSRPGGQGEPEAAWSGEMTWSVESLVPKRLTLPVHRMRLSVEFPQSGSVASFEPIFTDARMLGSSDGSPDVRCTGDYIIIDGPGIIRTHLTGPNPPPPPSAEGPAAITLTMPAPGLPTPIVIQAHLYPQQPATSTTRHPPPPPTPAAGCSPLNRIKGRNLAATDVHSRISARVNAANGCAWTLAKGRGLQHKLQLGANPAGLRSEINGHPG